MKISSILVLLLILGCSTKRTQYQRYDKKEGGYRDAVVVDGIHSTRFEANSLTKRSYANLFARFRAIEECGPSLAHILGIVDRSSSKKVTRSNGDAWGPSYYGGFQRYSGFGFSTGINVINSRSWEETLVYPDIEVLYHCTDKVFEPELVMREIPAEDMKHLVKDLKGGVQVDNISADSPNKDIHQEDIIIRADGKRVMKGYEILALFKNGERVVPIEVLRDGERKSLTLRARDVTKLVSENLESMKRKACKFDDVKKASSLCGGK